MKVNVNADVGESFGHYPLGNDGQLIPLIGSASIACGMHAGDPTTMARTVRIAVASSVSIGAHPGFDDRWGFGRRRIEMDTGDLEHLVAYQIGALSALAAANGGLVTHVKPHGALNNMAMHDRSYADAIVRAVHSVDAGMIFVANVGTHLVDAAQQIGLRIAHEFYADRKYNDDGHIISRKYEHAVIRDPQTAAEQTRRAVCDGVVISVSGREIPVNVDSICIHGDEPTAVPVARAVRATLAEEGVELVPLPALFAT
jgi:UPF0271 protein